MSRKQDQFKDVASTSQRRILWLINPKRKYRFNWDLMEVTAIMGKKTVGHPLALPTLAALTPARYNIRIIDEEMSPIPIHERPDLVGITGLISNIRRGYEIADDFRARNIPVVMGGPQVTFNIAETLTHANTVVAGEAESVWETLLADFEQGKLKQVYRAAEPVPFKQSPKPRWDLLDTSKMLTFSVQVSRGCPHRCDFCLVRKLFGQSQRYRDLDNVIEEIEMLPQEAQIAFADDNLTADKRYAKELMRRLSPLRRSWSCQASLDAALDPELLTLMSKAGCNAILIGFETLNPKSLEEAHKTQNQTARYQIAVENAHRAGIHVLASFVVGFDADTVAAFEDIRRFTETANLSFVMINALSVYPGTDLFNRMKNEGRITTINTDLCNGLYPTMRYVGITQSEMFAHIIHTLDRIYSFESLSNRGPAVLGNGAFREQFFPPISKMVKLRSVLHLLFRYALSSNKFKRRLLYRLIALVKQKRLSVGAMMQYLLFVTSIRGYLAFNKRQSKSILSELNITDRQLASAPELIKTSSVDAGAS